jgi:predicted DNA-binding transcriptional regulator YafY
MDILKYGRDVEVVSPPDLRKRVAEEARALAKFYSAS